MKRLFKSVDEKLKEIGFNKTRENEYGVEYERYISDYKYTQILSIECKANGRHLISSYDRDLHGKNFILGNVGVGLSYYETKLILKKMRQWKKKYNV